MRKGDNLQTQSGRPESVYFRRGLNLNVLELEQVKNKSDCGRSNSVKRRLECKLITEENQSPSHRINTIASPWFRSTRFNTTMVQDQSHHNNSLYHFSTHLTNTPQRRALARFAHLFPSGDVLLCITRAGKAKEETKGRTSKTMGQTLAFRAGVVLAPLRTSDDYSFCAHELLFKLSPLSV